MSASTVRSHLHKVCLLLLMTAASWFLLGVQGSFAAGQEFVNGFHLSSLPGPYDAQERLFASLSGSGANAVLLDLPRTRDGEPDLNALANATYLVHQAGYRIFIIMPTRRAAHRALEQHPEWEDRQYDIAERSMDRSGKLDLFQNAAIAYLAEQARTIAEHAVDGILLGEDFVYETGDGFGKQAVGILEKKLKFDIAPKRLFLRTERSANGVEVAEYGDEFWKWTDAKRDRLIDAYTVIRAEARKVNTGVKIGVPVPVVQPVATAQELLARYAFDQSSYRRADVDLYWTSIDYRDQKADERLTFSESLQYLARSAYAAMTSIKETSRMIVVLQASTAAGKAIPMAEIEQTTAMVRRAGGTGIVYSITPATVPSATLTKRMFQSGE